MKKPSLKDIARLASVSRATVDRALHGRSDIKGKTRELILQIAREHRYKPHPVARALVLGRAPLSIGVCIPREIRPFYDQVRDGILEEARRFESVGIKVTYCPYERLGKGEHEHLKRLLKRGPKAVILTPGVDRRVKELIDGAERRGIRVVCVAGDLAHSLRSTAVHSDAEVNSRFAAELMAKFIPRKPRVVIFTGSLHSEIQAREVNSFCQAFEMFSNGGRVLEVVEDHDSPGETLEKCVSLLKRVGRIDGMYISTNNCLPVCAALEAGGMGEKVKLVTTDLFPEMVPWFDRGTIFASVYQRPFTQGQMAVRLVVDHLLDGRPFPPPRYLEPTIVLRSNLHLFREVAHPDGKRAV